MHYVLLTYFDIVKYYERLFNDEWILQAGKHLATYLVFPLYLPLLLVLLISNLWDNGAKPFLKFLNFYSYYNVLFIAILKNFP